MEAARHSRPATDSFQVSLRIRHPSIDPEEISEVLGIIPEHCFRAGEPRAPGRRGSAAGVHLESYWIGVLKPLSPIDLTPFVDQRARMAQRQLDASRLSLTWTLSLSAGRLLSQHAKFLRRIRSEGGEIRLLVIIDSSEVQNFVLPDETSRLLGNLGITVEFELASGD